LQLVDLAFPRPAQGRVPEGAQLFVFTLQGLRMRIQELAHDLGPGHHRAVGGPDMERHAQMRLDDVTLGVTKDAIVIDGRTVVADPDTVISRGKVIALRGKRTAVRAQVA